MPIHDWTRAPAGLFHHFHQDWSIELARTLNRDVLAQGYYALIEQRVEGPEPDVIAVEAYLPSTDSPRQAILERPQTTAAWYAKKANRISIQHPRGNVVAVLEIVSPGNKSSQNAISAFVQKAVSFLRAGIHLLIIDLFPPPRRNLQGLHRLIWEQFEDTEFQLPEDRRLTLASYEAGAEISGFVEPAQVGDPLKSMPLFLAPGEHVLVPLESTYMATWNVLPRPIRDLVSSAE
jgi:hypothetical protein